MADNLLARIVAQKTDALRSADGEFVINLVKKESPSLYLQFQTRLTQKNLQNANWNSLAYQREVSWLAMEYAKGLLATAKENPLNEGRKDSELMESLSAQINSYVPPVETLESGRRIAEDREDFQSKYREKLAIRIKNSSNTRRWISSLKEQEQVERAHAFIEKTIDEAASSTKTKNDFLSVVRECVFQELGTEASRATSEDLRSVEQQGHLQDYFSGVAYEEFRNMVANAQVDDMKTFAVLSLEERTNSPDKAIKSAEAEVTQRTKMVEAFGADALDPFNSFMDAQSPAAVNEFVRSIPGAGSGALVPISGTLHRWVLSTSDDVLSIVRGESLVNTLSNKALLKERFGENVPTYIFDLKNHVSGRLVDLTGSPSAQTLHARAVLATARALGHTKANPAAFNLIADLNVSLDGDKTILANLLSRKQESLQSPPPGMHLGVLHRSSLGMPNMFADFWLSKDSLLAMAHARGQLLTHLAFSLRGTAGWFLRLGAGRIGGKAAGILASWGFKALLGKATGAIIGQLAIPIPFVGALIGGLVGNLALGKIFGGIKRLFGGGSGKRKWHEDPSSWQFVALLVGAPIIIILFLSFQTMSMLSGAFFVTSPRNIGGGLPGSTIIKYTGQTPAPAPLSTAPVTGKLSQGPFKPGTTHEHADAVDILKNSGDPIVFAQDCLIVSNGTENGCLWDTNLGNYVRCAGNCGGQQCFTTYAHLSSCSNAVINAIPGDTNQALPATLMKTGTVLGFIGSTGNSTGPHLHFQYNGPGSLTDYFPSIANGSL